MMPIEQPSPPANASNGKPFRPPQVDNLHFTPTLRRKRGPVRLTDLLCAHSSLAVLSRCLLSLPFVAILRKTQHGHRVSTACQPQGSCVPSGTAAGLPMPVRPARGNEALQRVGRCLCPAFPLSSWPRHCLCRAFPLPSCPKTECFAFLQAGPLPGDVRRGGQPCGTQPRN